MGICEGLAKWNESDPILFTPDDNYCNGCAGDDPDMNCRAG